MRPDPWLLFCVFGLLAAPGRISDLFDERLWVSEPLAIALTGIALGPANLGLLGPGMILTGRRAPSWPPRCRGRP